MAVALINHNELSVVTCAREPGTHKAMDVMDVVEKVVREQLEGTLVIGPGGDGGEDDTERARR